MKREGRMLKSKIIIGLLIVCLVVGFSTAETMAEDTSEIYITNIYIDEFGIGVGNFVITGYIENSKANAEVVLIIASDTEVTEDSIVWIDQTSATGPNGSFIFNGAYDAKFGGKTAYINIGAMGCEKIYKQEIELPFAFDATIETVANNSAIYGVDVYRIENNSDLNTENVRDSILNGGNCLYYKIGGNWYNLLDKNAINSDYIIPKNAVDIETIYGREYRYYYNGNQRLNFEKTA